ncbi:MAG: (d)CMP kinase [Chitinophagaceae bacterium]|jgi:cytidylate kinase
MKKIVIAIDGWSSCGKSTMARQLARKLNYIFIDSGAMYRAITLYFLRNEVDTDDEAQIENALLNINLSFQLNPVNGNNEIWLNGENVDALIREIKVAEKVSEVAALRQVREFAVAQQRSIGQAKGIVMDGRDIGSVVFPDAELKIFMTADPEIRVQRRLKELQVKNPDITIDEVRANLASRDHIDSTRAISPLRKPEDALVLDNSFLSPEQQLELALQWSNEKIMN